MSKNLRISLYGLTGAVAGFVLQGCFAAQPTPECSVTITAAALGLAPYYVKLTKQTGTGTQWKKIVNPLSANADLDVKAETKLETKPANK